jgi:hypothetical protein
VKRWTTFERAAYRSLGRLLTGRWRRGFTWHVAQLPAMVVFGVLSVGEIVALDLLIPWPWTWLRIAVLAVGLWGAVLTLGIVAATIVRPHLADPEGLVIRAGVDGEWRIAWAEVGGVRRIRASPEGRGVQLADGVLTAAVSSQVNVELLLARPVPLALPGREPQEVRTVRCFADDPAAMIAAVRVKQRMDHGSSALIDGNSGTE